MNNDEKAFADWIVTLPTEAAFLADGGSRVSDYSKLYSEAWEGWLAGMANFRATAANACDELAVNLKDENAIIAARICAATIRTLGTVPISLDKATE